jgi:hypothetical protein
MNKFGWSVLSSLLLGVAMAAPASADILTYNWKSGSSLTFSDGSTASLVGSFTFNTDDTTLTGSDIVVTGPGVFDGTYVPYSNEDDPIIFRNLSTGGNLVINFYEFLQPILNLNSASLENCCGTSRSTGLSGAVGEADLTTAVPEPATWAMMLLGFAGIGFMAYRRKSKPLMAA